MSIRTGVALAAMVFVSVAGIGAMASAREGDDLGLKPLPAEWAKVNPYRGDAHAIIVGKTAFANNCARCHGIDAQSGGIAPDLRYLPMGEEGDAIFSERVQKGASRDGRVLMPPMAPTLGQAQLWAIRSWLDTVHQE